MIGADAQTEAREWWREALRFGVCPASDWTPVWYGWRFVDGVPVRRWSLFEVRW